MTVRPHVRTSVRGGEYRYPGYDKRDYTGRGSGSGYATGSKRYDDDYKSYARETNGGYAPYSQTRTTTHNEDPYKHLAHIIPTHITPTRGSHIDPFYMSRNENVRLWLEVVSANVV